MAQDKIRSSVTDIYPYRNCCLQAAKNPTLFANFRRLDQITNNIDTVNAEYGDLYLSYIRSHYPFLIELMPEFAKNDSVGKPHIQEYSEIGPICPTTLRYVKTFGDLISLYGRMDGWKVFEIGGGYGGLCRILSSQAALEKYSIIDLPETLALIKTYLDNFSITNMEWFSPKSLPAENPCDLVISNYAFTECRKEFQEAYLDRVLRFSKRGYMVCNYANHVYELTSYSSDELKRILENFGFRVQVKENIPVIRLPFEEHIITWSSL